MDDFVKVAADGWNFERGGKPFHCTGVNYFPSDVGWAPQLWRQFDAEKTRRHFALMEETGIRVARVFLTWASFLPERAKGLNPQAMERLRQTLRIAEEFGVLLHPTGPDHWEGGSDWMPSTAERDHFAHPEVLETLAEFWAMLAGELKDCPNVFAWDLLNEPHMNENTAEQAGLWADWRKMQPETARLPETYPVTLPENPDIREAYLRFRGQIARNWVKIQTDAIRAADPNHMVTVGLLWFTGTAYGPGYAFDPAFIDDLTDFTCLHYYPPAECGADPARYEQALDELELFIRSYYTGKPVVLQEFGWYGTNEAFAGWGQEGFESQGESVQADFMARLLRRTRGICSGWLPWGLLDVPQAKDLSKYSGLFTSEGLPKEYKKVYEGFCSDVAARGLIRQAAPVRAVDLDYVMRNGSRGLWDGWLGEQRLHGPSDFSYSGGGVK